MGPRFENRGFDIDFHGLADPQIGFNGSTVREPWFWADRQDTSPRVLGASMGPRFENRGFVGGRLLVSAAGAVLQWVHGSRTVVLLHCLATLDLRRFRFNGSTVREPWFCSIGNGSFWHSAALQWVHGSRTVVLSAIVADSRAWRSRFNGSTVREPWFWRAMLDYIRLFAEASMGPRFENRGFGDSSARLEHRRQASMGPRFENRGFVCYLKTLNNAITRFNGSTVREPWFCFDRSADGYRR